MADLPEKPKKDEDVYQYSGEESPDYGSGAEEAPQLGYSEEMPIQDEGPLSRFKRVYIIIGLVIAVFIVYGFLSAREKAKEQQTAQPQVSSTVTTAQVQTKQQENTQAQQTQQSVGQVVQAGAATSGQVESLKQDVARNQAHIQQLAVDISETRTSLDQLNQAIHNTDDMVQVVSVKLDNLIAAQPKKPVKRVKPQPKPVYDILAMVPGRAWLQVNHGRTITVREGDPIKGYGRVSHIDPLAGEVITTAGKVIRYTPGYE